MKWEPIEKYDAMKAKPKRFTVFLVAPMKTGGRSTLEQTISVARHMGYRKITHYCVLPVVPTEKENKDDVG